MKNLKIHFWDNLSSHAERTLFRNQLTALGIQTSTNQADLTDINLLFIHGGDSPTLNNYDFQTIVYKVSFGDNATDLKPIFAEENRISYINADELKNRFEKIYEELKIVPELTIESLYSIIFGFDKELETFLEPYETASPYATEYTAKDNSKKSLKNAKAELQTYVEKYLNK